MSQTLLPPSLRRDPNVAALADLLERALPAELLDRLLVYLIDQVPAAALPALAQQFHADWWDWEAPEAQQREIVKSLLVVHRHKGTPWAVREALRVAGLSAELVEWWQQQPTGTPYTFRLHAALEAAAQSPALLEVVTQGSLQADGLVRYDGSRAYDGAGRTIRPRLLRAIAAYGNARSWLSGIDLAVADAEMALRIEAEQVRLIWSGGAPDPYVRPVRTYDGVWWYDGAQVCLYDGAWRSDGNWTYAAWRAAVRRYDAETEMWHWLGRLRLTEASQPSRFDGTLRAAGAATYAGARPPVTDGLQRLTLRRRVAARYDGAWRSDGTLRYSQQQMEVTWIS